jgi:hypothetical protein
MKSRTSAGKPIWRSADGRHRAVADPRARVGARARLDRRTVAVDERVRERRLRRTDELRRGGDVELDAREERLPAAADGRLLRVHHRPRRALARDPLQELDVRLVEGNREQHLPALAGREVEIPRQHAAGEAGRVDRLHRRREAAVLERLGHAGILERGRAERVGGRQRDHGLAAVHADDAVVVADLADRRDAAHHVERLPWGQHLERPHRKQQATLLPPPAAVLDAVARVEQRRTRVAARERRDPERERVVLPRHARDRQVLLLERLRALDVVPRDEPLARPQERLDREAGAIDLEHAVVVQQRFLVVGLRADDRPVRLLAREVAGKSPRRCSPATCSKNRFGDSENAIG